MNHEQDRLIEELIGRHLGISDEPEPEAPRAPAAEVERLLSNIDSVLAPLASWRVPDAPADLNASIMRRIDSATQTISFEEAAAAANERAARRAGGWFLSVRDLVAAAACITLLVGLFAPGYYHARRLAERQACRSNLSSIYAGMAAFGADHQGQLPCAEQGIHPRPEPLGARPQHRHPTAGICTRSSGAATCPPACLSARGSDKVYD